MRIKPAIFILFLRHHRYIFTLFFPVKSYTRQLLILPRRTAMTAYIVGGVILVILLSGYLIYALIHAEEF